MNINEFKKELDLSVYEQPEDAALSALTALLLKDILPDQKERFNYIKDFLTSTGFPEKDMPVLAKVKEIYHLYLENEKKTIDTLFEAEKNIARFLQKRKLECDPCLKSPPKNCQPKKETVINKWW